MGFTYGSDYYDPSEPTEEEEPSKQRGEGSGLPAVTHCTPHGGAFRVQVWTLSVTSV